MNKIKELIKTPTSIILITLTLVIVIALRFNSEAWTPNIITSAFEIFLTVFIVDRVLKKAEARKFSQEQASKLTIFSEILNQYFQLHLRSIVIMTSPVNEFNWDLKKLKFNSLSNIYKKMSLLRLGPLFQMPYEQYFETKATLLSYLRKSLLELNPVVYNDITTLLSKYLVRSDEYNSNLKNCVTERLNTITGDKHTWEFDVEMIKGHTGLIEFPKTSNAIDIYIQIWKDIEDTLATYDQFIKLIDKHKITINNK